MLISRQSASAGGGGGDADSAQPSSSADGSIVAFSSLAENLSSADDPVSDVFRHDRPDRVTRLVSRESASAGGQAANADSLSPSSSADGRLVAFISQAANLSGADGEGYDVFLRDLRTGRTRLVSRQSEGRGGDGGDDQSFSPSISADGRYVAFESLAGNLSGADRNDRFDVYVRDMETKETRLVSRQGEARGGRGGNGDSIQPTISPGGRFVAFASEAENLSGGDVATYDVFLRDTRDKTTRLVSREGDGSGGEAATNNSFDPSISEAGDFVAFESQGNNLSDADENAYWNIFVRDVERSATRLVSRRSAGDGGDAANGHSHAAAISMEGRFVAFESVANNLSGADRNAFQNVFLRDVDARKTRLVSRESEHAGGAGADGESGSASISGGGRFVAFQSLADNLSSADEDGVADVFRHDELGP